MKKLFPFQQEENIQDEAPKGATLTYPEKETVVLSDAEGWWKPFWTLSALLIFIGVVWSLFTQLWHWMDRPIEKVEVFGTVQHLDKQQLGEKIARTLSPSLLQVDLAAVQEMVRQQPWVRVASIEKDWPATLRVQVEEEVPVARWGEKGLLNHQGDIFWPQLKEQYRGLPRLSGPSPDTNRVMSQFHDLNQMFRSAGLQVVSLDLEARGAWTLELNNSIRVVVGRENINERLQRFLELYQLRLAERSDEIEKVDIRYTHGVAVKWREQTDEENAG